MTEQHDDARGSADGRPAAEGSPKRSVAARLVDLAQARYAVFLGEDGEPYAVQRDGPGVAWPLRGREGLRQRLARGFFVASGQVASAAALADALNVLEGQALEADRRPVALRTAAHGRAVVLDLGTADQPQPADDTAGAPPTGTDDQGATVHPMRPPSSRSSALSTPYELHERITSEVADGTDGRSDHPHRCAVCDQPMTPLLEPGQTTHPACDQPQTPCEACGNPNESTEVSPYCHGCRTPEEVSAYAG